MEQNKLLVNPLHFLYWLGGYKNEMGEKLRLADGNFCFCEEGEEPEPITSKGIIQLYSLKYPDAATDYAALRAKAEKMERTLRLIQEQSEDPDNDNDPGVSLWNIQNLCKEQLKQEGEKEPVAQVVTNDAHEKEVMMKAFDDVRRIFEGRQWIMEGRGSYPYNDDRYKEEVRYLYNEFDAIYKNTWANIKSKSVDYRQQIIAQYLHDHPQHGPVWVKAEDRLPGCSTPVKWRRNSKVRDGKETMQELIRLRPASFMEYEWLDESGKEVNPKTRAFVHNNSDAFRHWAEVIKGMPIIRLDHNTAVFLPEGVTESMLKEEWSTYEKANNPAQKEVKPPSIILEPGLQFRNVHMPGYTFFIRDFVKADNICSVLIVNDTHGTQWTERDWNLEHTLWAFEKGEYYMEPDKKG